MVLTISMKDPISNSAIKYIKFLLKNQFSSTPLANIQVYLCNLYLKAVIQLRFSIFWQYSAFFSVYIRNSSFSNNFDPFHLFIPLLSFQISFYDLFNVFILFWICYCSMISIRLFIPIILSPCSLWWNRYSKLKFISYIHNINISIYWNFCQNWLVDTDFTMTILTWIYKIWGFFYSDTYSSDKEETPLSYLKARYISTPCTKPMFRFCLFLPTDYTTVPIRRSSTFLSFLFS